MTLKLLITWSLFEINLSVNCSSITQCKDNHYCMKRQAMLTYIGQNKIVDDYSCEPSNLCEILTNNTCQKMNLTRSIPYYAGKVACNSLKPTAIIPITLDTALDCCSTNNCSSQFNRQTPSECPIFNGEVSSVIEEVIKCYVPENILTHIQCNNSETCSLTLQNHMDNYPYCACKILFDELGIEGYDYLSIVSNWVQQYVGEMLDHIGIGDFVNKCGGFQLDCFPLIKDCRINTNGINTNDISIEYDNECIEDVYEHIHDDGSYDDKGTSSNAITGNMKLDSMLIIIIVSVVGGICICVLTCYIVNQTYSKYKTNKQMTDVNTVNDLGDMDRVKSDTCTSIGDCNSKLNEQGEYNGNNNNVTDETAQVEGLTNHTKTESAVRLDIIETEENDNMEHKIDISNILNEYHDYEESNAQSDDDNKMTQQYENEIVEMEGMETQTGGDRGVFENDIHINNEKKEDILLDEMLSDILKMESLDPNKIHEMNVKNSIDKQINHSDSDNSDNMYE